MDSRISELSSPHFWPDFWDPPHWLDENEALTLLNQALRRALNDARERGFTEADIKAVLMVGGSSQIPVR